MQNLINAIRAEYRAQLGKFILEINQTEDFSSWWYRELTPKGRDLSKMSPSEKRAYLIGRKEKAINKQIEREVAHIRFIDKAGEFEPLTINVEWKRNRTWGANPTAEMFGCHPPVSSGSIGGCGYDKLSTAVARVLNHCAPILRLMYQMKDQNIGLKNHELFGYGSGYGLLPHFEGGVGVSCYPRIFEKLGLKFETTASGKMFDSFRISKL